MPAAFGQRVEAAVARRTFVGERYAMLTVELVDLSRVHEHHIEGVRGELAERLHDCLREHDHVAPIAGDAYVVLLENCQEHHAHALATRIELALTRPVELAASWVRVRARVGVAFDARLARRVGG